MIVTVPVSEVPAGGILAVPVNESLTLAVCRHEGAFHAVDNRCPHRGAPLAGGELAGELLVCPLHHFKFSLKTGRCVMPKHLKLRSFPVEERDGALLITVESEVKQDAPGTV